MRSNSAAGRDPAGHRVCLVSSGAVGMGCQVLRLTERPEAVSKRQALAAIGQGALMRVYTDFFNALSLVCCFLPVSCMTRACLLACSASLDAVLLVMTPAWCHWLAACLPTGLSTGCAKAIARAPR